MQAATAASGPRFGSPSVLTENFFVGLVIAACRERKVAGQTTQRPKHTVQTLQPGELTARSPSSLLTHSLFCLAAKCHQRCSSSVYACPN